MDTVHCKINFEKNNLNAKLIAYTLSYVYDLCLGAVFMP